jgi:hypothetical protein
MANKDKKYNNFRDFYEDDDRPRKKLKAIVNESQKKKDKFKKQIRFLDPKNLKEDDWDEFEEFDKVK